MPSTPPPRNLRALALTGFLLHAPGQRLLYGTRLSPRAFVLNLWLILATIVAVVLTAIIVLAWQLASTGPLDTAALARSVSSPVVVLLPPALAFVAALLLATTMPPLLRAISRRSRRAPLALRLSLLSLSRDPGRPAATVTLLAFSIGAIVFATCWSATLPSTARCCRRC